MSLPYFLASVEALREVAAGDEVTLDGDEGRHAVVVRRIRAGEQVVLTDGAGTAVTCEVIDVARAGLVARVLAVEVTEPPRPRLVVVQAIPKGERGELAVEMLTEVGVDVIVPWASSRGVAVWRGDRAARSLAKWRNAAREASKQARRNWLPEVTEPAGTEEVVALLEKAALPVVLHEAASGPMSDLVVPGGGDLVIVVGPEGGITDEELAAFAYVGAEPMRMGTTVLRTSTAGVAAAAALLSRTARWR